MWIGVPSGSLLESVRRNFSSDPTTHSVSKITSMAKVPLFVRMSVEAINRFHDSTTPEEKPKWDLVSRTLTF